ncbi:MAG: coenzyme F420-0:L-glutamate ligase [Micrococcales bacterium]|nr:coenzyme F420-0:L-glutamate ligase [Micrococcales bacterium]
MASERQELQIFAVPGLPEIKPGDDLAALILSGLDLAGRELLDGDILVITSKVVSKAEDRIVAATDREAVITAETVRLVASRQAAHGGATRIVENKLGIVSAAAGVDESNTPVGTVLVLPEDPDASARNLANQLRQQTGKLIGVIISDTLGRPWRQGQTDVAIGAAGVVVCQDLRGSTDSFGRRLSVTVMCLADELAAATDLVKGKTWGRPVAIVRGAGSLVGSLDLPGAKSIVRLQDQDMFRQGSLEARQAGFKEGWAAGLAAGRNQDA